MEASDKTSQRRKPIHKRSWLVLSIILAVIVVCAAAFAAYVSAYYHADEAAVQAMAPNEVVSVYEL